MNPDEFFIPEFTKPVRLQDGTETDGIYDNQHQQVFDLNATAPQIALRAADATRVQENDSIWIDNIEHIAKDREHNDEGITIIHLQTL